MTERIFNIIFEEDEVTWLALLKETVKSGEMDPWDIDISKLTHEYIEMAKQAQEQNMRISGKVLLAAAILLRIKSTKLLEEDVAGFDALLTESDDELLYEDGVPLAPQIDRTIYRNLKLYPRTPQPRKKKVSIYDLIEALQKALEVSKRRERRQKVELPEFVVPELKIDIDEVITKLQQQIADWFSEKDEDLTFTHLVPDETKTGRMYTFVPLLHLTNARHIDLVQDKHLGEIRIREAKPDLEEPNIAPVGDTKTESKT